MIKTRIMEPDAATGCKNEAAKLGPYEVNHLYNEDCLAGLKSLPDDCIDVAVTSPPYWGQRGNAAGAARLIDIPAFLPGCQSCTFSLISFA
jgi:hypothetical protein